MVTDIVLPEEFIITLWVKAATGGTQTVFSFAALSGGGLEVACEGSETRLTVDGLATTSAGSPALCSGDWVFVRTHYARGSVSTVSVDSTVVVSYATPATAAINGTIESAMTLGQSQTAYGVGGSAGSDLEGFVAEVRVIASDSGASLASDFALAYERRGYLAPDTYSDSDGLRTWLYWSFEKHVQDPSHPSYGTRVWASTLKGGRGSVPQRGDLDLVLSGGASVSPEMPSLWRVDRGHQSSLLLENGASAHAVAAVGPSHTAAQFWVKCWPETHSQTLLSMYAPALQAEILRLEATATGHLRATINGTELGLSSAAVCVGQWRSLYARIDDVFMGVRIRMRGHDNGATHTFIDNKVAAMVLLPDQGEDGSDPVAVVSLGRAITGLVSGTTHPVFELGTEVTRAAFFDLVIHKRYNDERTWRRFVCHRLRFDVDEWLFADASSLGAPSRPGTAVMTVSPGARALRDRPRLWQCPASIASTTWRGRALHLLALHPAEQLGVDASRTQRMAAEIIGDEDVIGRLVELETEAKNAAVAEWVGASLPTIDGAAVPSDWLVRTAAGLSGTTQWLWSNGQYPADPFWDMAVGSVEAPFFAAPARSPWIPGGPTGLALTVDVVGPGDRTITNVTWEQFDPDRRLATDGRPLAFVVEMGNCSTMAAIDSGSGGCLEGFRCCSGTCVAGNECMTLEASKVYDGHLYQIYSVIFPMNIGFVLDHTLTKFNDTYGAGYVVQITTEEENAFVTDWALSTISCDTFFIDGTSMGHSNVWRYFGGPLAGEVFADHRGSTPITYTFAKWSNNEPNGYFGDRENYVQIRSDKTWNDVPFVRSDNDCVIVEFGVCSNNSDCPSRMVCDQGRCGCPGSFWGLQCTDACGCAFGNTIDPSATTCDRLDGSCVTACASGWEGANCTTVAPLVPPPPPPSPPPPPASVCGDGVVTRPLESCDDTNAVAGDGCSAACAIESGWACPVDGAPCISADVTCGGGVMDCEGACGGSAQLDACGVCSGGTTGRVFNQAKDVCGVCFGPGIEWCGQCGDVRDACGVCLGDNTTCAGCDGVPNSGIVVDVCGVCGGDASSCLGCDGIPIPLGGALYDACGVCGGPAEGTCLAGCGGVPNAAFDCAGVCQGTAYVDDCGICVGGNTTLTENMHAANCGDCFGVCGACSAAEDVCGICDGDGTTCVGCDGVLVADGGQTVDVCGVCGGNGTSCVVPCDGVPGSGAVFDCAGICGGTAAIDDCGVCYGGILLGVIRNMHVDDCDVCFGGNTDMDACGICDGNNAERDNCGQCFGDNAVMDDCGVCFGLNRNQDTCGVCFGNHTSCIGCDGIPRSEARLDSCGVCRGTNACVAHADSDVYGVPRLVAGIAFGALVICALMAAVLIAVLMRSRMRKRVVVGIAEATLAEAPSAEHVVFAITDIQDSSALWETVPVHAMERAMEIHDEVARAAIQAAGGLETHTEGDAFFAVFHTPAAAISYALSLQENLGQVLWPEALRGAHPSVADEEFGGFAGLRVRVGIHAEYSMPVFDERSHRPVYRGSAIKNAEAVSDAAIGGQVLVSGRAMQMLEEQGGASSITVPHVLRHLGAADTVGELWEVLPKSVADRSLVFAEQGTVRIEAALTGFKSLNVQPLETQTVTVSESCDSQALLLAHPSTATGNNSPLQTPPSVGAPVQSTSMPDASRFANGRGRRRQSQGVTARRARRGARPLRRVVTAADVRGPRR